MAQAGYTPIQLYFSTTAAAVPTSGNLANGELAINITDGKLYYKSNAGVVTLLAGATSGPAGGSNTQVQFNSSGALAGDADLTFDGTTLTANALTVTNAVTLSGGTANGVAYLNGSKVVTSGSALTFNGTSLTIDGGTAGYLYGPAGELMIGEDASGLYIGNGGGGVPAIPILFGSTATTYQRFNAGGSEQMRLTSTGLGIGTSSPSSKLDIVGVTQWQATAGTVLGKLTYSGGEPVVLANTGLGLQFFTNNAFAAKIDSSGNLGLGVTPSAWTSGARVLQFPNTGSIGTEANGYLTSIVNARESSSNAWSYLLTGAGASKFKIDYGSFAWYTAPSGTAGNTITFTQAMTLTDTGRLGIGSTSPSTNLHIGTGSGGNGLGVLVSRGSGTNFFEAYDGTKTFIGGTDSDNAFVKVGSLSNHPVSIVQSNGSAIYIDTSKNVGIGQTNPGYKLHIVGGSTVASSSLQIQVTDNVANQISFSNGYGNREGLVFLGDGSSGNFSFGVISTQQALTFQTAAYNIGGASNLSTGWTERARIDSSGNLLVGTTNFGATRGFEVRPESTGQTNARASSTSNNSAYSCWDMYYITGGTYAFYVGWNGTINAVNTTISAISDQRLKENIVDLDVGLDAIMALKPRKFDWKAGKGKDIKGDRGWIAQEFETVFPDLIDTWKDPAPEGEEPYKSVRADLIPVLVKAIQEQQTIINSLKARLDAANL